MEPMCAGDFEDTWTAVHRPTSFHASPLGMLHHGANPILRWSMANLVVKADHDGGLKPDKRRSHEKIDAVVALTMALDGVVRQPLETGSVYDTRGVEFV